MLEYLQVSFSKVLFNGRATENGNIDELAMSDNIKHIVFKILN